MDVTPEQIIEITNSRILEIIKWTIGVVTPVIIALTTAIGILWFSLKNKNDKIDSLNDKILEIQRSQIKEYYETLKSLAPYFEKSAEVQSHIYDMCDNISNILKKLDVKIENYDINNISEELDKLRDSLIKNIDSVKEYNIDSKVKLQSIIDKLESIKHTEIK